MDTPAAALIRRTETPSCPYCLRQRNVASTSASRRTAGVARRNFRRLVAIESPFYGLEPRRALRAAAAIEPVLYHAAEKLIRDSRACGAPRPQKKRQSRRREVRVRPRRAASGGAVCP